MSILEEARATLDGVTPAPWRWEGNSLYGGAGFYDDVLTPGLVDCMAYCYGGASTIEGDNLGRDKALIAAAPELIARLITALESVQQIADNRQRLADQLRQEKGAALADARYWERRHGLTLRGSQVRSHIIKALQDGQ